eukprot:3940251-Rhodomonas_salina.2
MSGTGIAYAAVCLRACYAMSGTDLRHNCAISYANATRCPVLTKRMVLGRAWEERGCRGARTGAETAAKMPGGYPLLAALLQPAAPRLPQVPTLSCYDPPTPLSCYDPPTPCPVPRERMVLCACYAISSTEGYAPATPCPLLTERMMLCACYTVSGTDEAYGATSRRSKYCCRWVAIPIMLRNSSIMLRNSYAMSGTNIPYSSI